MENFIRLWQDSGIYHLQSGQFIMLLVGFLLLFFAIRKGFEPLLLVPIGFGCILSNVPGAGLSFTAFESALAFGHMDVYQALAQTLGAAQDVTAAELAELYKNASTAVQVQAHRVATDYGFSDGMLYVFYKVAIASGAAPLIIFMGVGAMTDFGPLLANPKTLFLGAANYQNRTCPAGPPRSAGTAPPEPVARAETESFRVWKPRATAAF